MKATDGEASFSVGDPTWSASTNYGAMAGNMGSVGTSSFNPSDMVSASSGLMAAPAATGDAGRGGVNINIEGDVYDSENFASKVSEVLPEALRDADDLGMYSVGAAGISKVVVK